MASCRDVEGWRIVSKLREFDFTLCFEEGVILTSILALLLLSATCRIWALRHLPSRVISRKSRWRLWVKLVRSNSFLCLLGTNFASRLCWDWLLSRLASTSSSSCHSNERRRSYGLTSSNHSRCLRLGYSLDRTIVGHGHRQPFSYYFGLFTPSAS